ncbi:MAG: AAA family ATPase, partial [Planctomycetota bacterium]
MAHFKEQISLCIRSRYPILYLVTSEEERVEGCLREIAGDLKKRLTFWSVTEGICAAEPAPVAADQASSRSPIEYGEVLSDEHPPRDPLGVLDHILRSREKTIFVLRDLHPHLEDPKVVRRLRDVVAALQRSYKTVVIISPVLKIPVEVEKDITIIDVPVPTRDELAELLENFLISIGHDSRFRVQLDAETKERVVHTVRGLTEAQTWRVLSKVTVGDRSFDGGDLEQILEEKRQEIRKTGILEYYERSESLRDIGGVERLKRWVSERREAFSERAREYGLPEPKGVLLLGVQGCGKSLSSKAIAATLDLPLLRLDVGRIFSSYVGASEANIRRAIALAEGLAPVVLWVDEIEKGFAGTRGAVADSGATMRVFATFLTWLQEKSEPVFVVATANQIHGLPPELLRKGRFDEIFFIDLPALAEREEIFTIHLEKRR